MLLEKIPSELISLDTNIVGKIDVKHKNIADREQVNVIKSKTNEIIEDQKKKIKKKLKGKEKSLIKELDKNEKMRQNVRRIMEINYKKKTEERETLNQDLKVLNMIDDEFNPELYIQEKRA